MEKAWVVDADAVEPPHVLCAGAIDLGQAPPGGWRIDVLDARRLRDAGLWWSEQAHPQHIRLVMEGGGPGAAEDDRAGDERLPHDGLGLLAEEGRVIRWRDGLGRGAVGASPEHAARQRRENGQEPPDQRTPDLPALGLLDGHAQLRGDTRADRTVEKRQAEPPWAPGG